MRFSHISLFSLVLSALACEPVSPIIEGNGASPVDGEWRMEVVDVESHGRCGIDDSELLGLTMGMTVETRDETGIRFNIDGMELKGTMDSGWLYATGRIVEDSPAIDVEVESDIPIDDEEDWDHGGSSSEGSDARTQEDREPRSEMGVHTVLEAIALTRTRMEGELTVEYDLPEMQCVLVLEFDAAHTGDQDRPPVAEPVEPVETEPKEEPVEVDEG